MSVALPTTYYRYAPKGCRQCDKVILVFDWPGHRERSGEPPSGKPVPPTIRHWLDKRTGEIYWINSCLHCRAVQWVDELCYGRSSLFGDLYYSDSDSPELYSQHMAKLVDHWSNVRDYYVAAQQWSVEKEQ